LSYLCDTHCHLYLEQFQDDLPAVIEKAWSAGVRKMLVPGIDVPSSIKALELAKDHPGSIYAAVGIHPNYSEGVGGDEIREIDRLFEENPDIKAVGEIGLDFYRTWASRESQIFVFKEMLKLAEKYSLPICLHVREAGEEILEVLKPWFAELAAKNHDLTDQPGVFHSFDGSARIADWALSHNFKLGINGGVTHKKLQALRDTLPDIGSDHLILETDAPFLTPHPHRGKRNEPAYLQFIIEKLASVLDMDTETLAGITSDNAGGLFRWNDD
jgi:TatD DNase family protein